MGPNRTHPFYRALRGSWARRPPAAGLALALLVLGTGLVSLGHALAPARSPEAVRLVSARVLVDGEVVLRGSTSDDGSPDADAVWAYLHELELSPTEAFGALGVEPDAAAVTLGWLKGKATEGRGDPPTLGLEIRYGGLDAPFLLGLVRSEAGDTWRVAPETVEARFPYRRITRAQAAALEDPERTGTR